MGMMIIEGSQRNDILEVKGEELTLGAYFMEFYANYTSDQMAPDFSLLKLWYQINHGALIERSAIPQRVVSAQREDSIRWKTGDVLAPLRPGASETP